MLATAASAAEKKTYSYTCKGGNFTVRLSTAPGQASDEQGRPGQLQIGAEPPQTLLADPDAPDADSYKNKDYEFYALKKFITLEYFQLTRLASLVSRHRPSTSFRKIVSV